MKSWMAFCFVALNLLSSLAEARFGKDGVLVDLSLYNNSTSYTRTENAAVAENKSTSMIYDLNVGKVSDKGYYYGVIYTSRSASANGMAGEGGNAIGVTLGLISESGYFVMGHYLVTATDNDMQGGSGIQLDGGFKFSIGNKWLLGGNFSYRSITYTKLKSEDPAFTSHVQTELFPMLSLGYLF